jgi:hypothetical protein
MASYSGNKTLAEPIERHGMATDVISLVEFLCQRGQRGVGCIELEVALNVGVSGPGAAAVGPYPGSYRLGHP